MAKQASVPEPDAQDMVAEWLREWFIVREEERGIGPLAKNARVDIWMFPKESTVQMAFEPKPLAVELKGYGLQDHRKRTAIRLVYQAMMYSMCEFRTLKGPQKPNMVLIYPRLEEILDIATRPPEEQAFLRGVEYGLARLGAMRGVGELELRSGYCRIWLNGAPNWDSVRGRKGTGQIANIAEREKYSR